MPAFEATVSEITEPTKADDAATFNEAKKSGIVRGTPTLRKICQREAPSERSTSRSSASSVARPTAAPKPSSVVTSVCQAWKAMGPAVCAIVWATPLGGGSTIGWTRSSITTASHTRTSATNTASGKATRRARERHVMHVRDPARVAREHIDRVGQKHRLAEIVGHEHACELTLRAQTLVELPHLLAR